jgi:phage terminase large subunit-like protein
VPLPVEFVNPQTNKVAHAEPFSMAVSKGRVLWNPTIFDRFPDLKDRFDLFPAKGIPDDDVDSISGGFLMGERRSKSLANFDVVRHANAAMVAAAAPPEPEPQFGPPPARM